MANFDLKSIFTSEDKYTIIQLLKEFVNTVDGVSFTQLFEHLVTVKDSADNEIKLSIINKNKTSLSGAPRSILKSAISKSVITRLYNDNTYNPIVNMYTILPTNSLQVVYVSGVELTNVGIVGAVIEDEVTAL